MPKSDDVEAQRRLEHGPSEDAGKQLLSDLSPLVEEIEKRLASTAFGRRHRLDVDRWQRLCGGERSSRSLATDAVLLSLCRSLAGDCPELSHLTTFHEACKIAKASVERARDECRRSPAMLGPLYEALALRRDRYSLGQYFTPAPIAEFMAGVVATSGAKTVLDPAVGAGALVAPLHRSTCVVGMDISPICIALTAAGMAVRGFKRLQLVHEDFLGDHRTLWAESTTLPAVDAVICNPPYMRHHLLSRAQKKELTTRFGDLFGTAISSLSTNYVYFFLEALDRLRDGGLLVFITPADFLDTRFGEGLKTILKRHSVLEEVMLFDRDELAFAGVLTTSAITIARKALPCSGHTIVFSEALVNGGVQRAKQTRRESAALDPASRWTNCFGGRQAKLERLTRDRPHQLSDYLRIRRGIATGANKFFVIPQQVVDEWGIEAQYLQRVIGSAKDLPDGELTEADWSSLRAKGRPCWFLHVEDVPGKLDGTRVLQYLKHGEELGVHERFNCRTRNPWYKPERVDPPDIIITYMNRGATRFVLNKAKCRVMSVFLNGFIKPECASVSRLMEELNSAETGTILGQLGRKYGGGLGKVEPGDLSMLPMPNLTNGKRARASSAQ